MTMVESPAIRRALWGSVAAAASLVLYSLVPHDAPTVAPSPAPPPAPPPAPAAPLEAAQAVAPLPSVSAEGLVLYGVSGGGSVAMAAIIAKGSGYPRVVPVGRDYRPGLTVAEVGPTHAIIVSAEQRTRLDLNGSATRVGASSAAPPGASPPSSFRGMDAVALRLGLMPRRQEGRITGFQLKAGADLPVLRQAGLQPGDVIVAVNGQAFESEEKLIELPQEIAGSYIAEFNVDRGGRLVKLTLPINQRPDEDR